jgi:hypothetical protein
MNRRLIIGIVVALAVVAFAVTMFTLNFTGAEANRETIEENAPATAEPVGSDQTPAGQGAPTSIGTGDDAADETDTPQPAAPETVTSEGVAPAGAESAQ